jgi:hypothetical protein
VGLLRRLRRRPDLGPAVSGLPSAPPAPVVLPSPSPVPRVELGFRDGTTAALPPDSPQARALRAVADLLVARE